jgi:hypothetical protein
MYEIRFKKKLFFNKHKVPKFWKFLKKILAWTVFFNFSNEYKKLLTRPLAIFFTIDAFDQFEPEQCIPRLIVDPVRRRTSPSSRKPTGPNLFVINPELEFMASLTGG